MAATAFIDFNPGAFAALRACAPDRPVGMLNQLKFRETAAYSDEDGETSCSGEEAYARYSEGALPLLKNVGAEAVLMGELWLIGPEADWDRTFLVRYPSLPSFLNMISSDGYKKIAHHRTAALADSRLLMMTFFGQDGLGS